ncbi:hypothetical protein BDY19DRAFT_379911 [Irpex rosettiformis]|uniref:Uncharacterized protein n=1 Tax=Irpex rosettiformis TaxID=378272 RepID=A0ACB8TVT6_9APHY|nr:hypothetical protein BDY19DRAFT_379911 [Irpex rosettiformis]
MHTGSLSDVVRSCVRRLCIFVQSRPHSLKQCACSTGHTIAVISDINVSYLFANIKLTTDLRKFLCALNPDSMPLDFASIISILAPRLADEGNHDFELAAGQAAKAAVRSTDARAQP